MIFFCIFSEENIAIDITHTRVNYLRKKIAEEDVACDIKTRRNYKQIIITFWFFSFFVYLTFHSRSHAYLWEDII